MELTSGGQALEDNIFRVTDFNADTYQGQAGFYLKDEGGVLTYTAYGVDDADYRYVLNANVEYKASSDKDARMHISLNKVIVELVETYTRSPEELFANVFNLTLTEQTRNNYIANSVDSLPTGESPDINRYCVYNAVSNRVTHLIIGQSHVDDFFEFDYSRTTGRTGGVNKGEAGYVSARFVAQGAKDGIALTYGTHISEAGVTNFAKIFLGFYGYGKKTDTAENSEYCRPFAFSGLDYQGSSFRFFFTAEVTDDV